MIWEGRRKEQCHDSYLRRRPTASLLENLRSIAEHVEVLDPEGKVLGLFVPASREQVDQLREDADAGIDWAEIERRAIAEAGQGCTLDQIFERMKTLTTDLEEQVDLQRHIDGMRAENGCDTRREPGGGGGGGGGLAAGPPQ